MNRIENNMQPVITGGIDNPVGTLDSHKQVSAGNINEVLKSVNGFLANDQIVKNSVSGTGNVGNANLGGMKTQAGDLSAQGEIFHIPENYSPLFDDVRKAINNNDSALMDKHFSAAVSAMVKDGIPVDVNALVQQVLRDSYVDTTADLQFYADKVKYFNEAKKMTREYVQDLRDFKTQFSDAAQAKGFCLSDPPSPTDANYLGWVSFQREFIDTHRQDANYGGKAAGMESVVAAYKASLAQAEDVACSGPGIKSVTAAGGWTTIVDNDGYTIKTNVPGGDQVQIYGPDGKAIVEIWGDPHVDEGFDGSRNDWHFGDDSTFILPNGTKICLNTEEQDKGSNIYYTKGVDVLSGTNHGVAGQDPVTNVNRTSGKSDDRIEWDMNHADTHGTTGGVFALPENSTSWAKLGADGKFYDIKYQSFDEYKALKGVAVTGTVVAMPDGVSRAANADSALREIVTNKDYLGTYADNESGKIASQLGLPTMIPPAGVTNAEELDNLISKYEEKLSTIGDDAQLANTDLQNVLQKQQQTIQMMSNISKMLNDTAMAVIRKIG